MKIPFFQKNQLKSLKEKKVFSLQREQILIWGTYILGIFFLGVLILDGYMLYHTFLTKKTREINVVRSSTFSRAKIEDVIHLLDERQKQFDEIKNKP